MDQAASLMSGTGATLAAVIQHWHCKAAPRKAGVEPLPDEPKRAYTGTRFDVTELQSSTPSTPNKTFSEAPLREWPHEPVPITNEPVVERSLDAVDVILRLLPCVLIMKAGLCVLASEIDKTHVGPSIDKTSQLTLHLINLHNRVTVRPVAAEKGATLGEIEQLHASISLTATLKTIWSLWRFTFTSLALIFLWSWYYVGSQAETRQHSYRNSASFGIPSVTFLFSHAIPPFQGDQIDIDKVSPIKLTDMTARYHLYSSFAAGTQKTNVQGARAVQGADIYGATLTPWYGPARDSSSLEFDRKGWLGIPHMSDQPVMSTIGTSMYWMNRTEGANA
ncbi:uncharacterized protein Z519_12767 [Cladophialophora bantiana CBS 173.52]|uniref:Uncharacterized protein n=1 Tax=Cladophialophora bantiana (strain ATCC 10958 / CBS 173.52 / CDC B-1940 / NIH 8579) TaxID=1442370 RepID=A0A0D2FIX2_CLAB1|nr:uncharacterized protein Z519_12767 [Cladophialophora bantiana CBS 173.52]KIW86642.1 hypothetical protein Z519_12767 [Cladophialophora bantiana CBS 173.52]